MGREPDQASRAMPSTAMGEVREALLGLQEPGRAEARPKIISARGMPSPSAEDGGRHEHAGVRAKGPLTRLNHKAQAGSLSDAARERQKRLIGNIDPDHPVLVTPVREKAASSAVAVLRAEERASRAGGVTGTGTPSWANKPRRSVVSERYEAGKDGLSRGSWAEDCYEAILLKRDVERMRLGGPSTKRGEGAKGYDFFEDRERRAGEGVAANRHSASPDADCRVGGAAHHRLSHGRYSASPDSPSSVNMGFMADQTRADMARDRLSVSPDAMNNVNVGFIADDTPALISPCQEGLGLGRVSLPWDVGTCNRSGSLTPKTSLPQGVDERPVAWRHSMLIGRTGGCGPDSRSREGKQGEWHGGMIAGNHLSGAAGQGDGAAVMHSGLGRSPASLITGEVTYSKQDFDLSGLEAPTPWNADHAHAVQLNKPRGNVQKAEELQSLEQQPATRGGESSGRAEGVGVLLAESISTWNRHNALAQAVSTGASRVSFSTTPTSTDISAQDPTHDRVTAQRMPISRRTAFDSQFQSAEVDHGTLKMGARGSQALADQGPSARDRVASERAPSSRILNTTVSATRIPESAAAYRGGGTLLGLEAMGNLALSARVHLHMGLTLPRGLAALIIQSVWRRFAVRKTAPILIAHAGRVCQVVDKHRRATIDNAPGSEEHSNSEVSSSHGVHSDQYGNMASEGLPDDCAPVERSRGAWWAFHSQDKHKQKVASSWSSRRVVYPLPQALRATCPYYSCGLEACLCVCFVSNFVAFYLESRSTEEPSSGSVVAVTRLQAIVEKQEREMLHKAQAHIRGWLTRRRALSVLMPPVTWSVKNVILAQKWRRAGCVVLSRMRQHVCVSLCGMHAAVIRQLHTMAQAELAFVGELDVAISHYLAHLNRAAGVIAPSNDAGLDKLSGMLVGVITPRDASRICGAVLILRERSGALLDALRSCLGGLPCLNLSNVLICCQELFPALCQHICNFPSSLTTLSKCRRFPAFALWIDSREACASAPLAASLLAPVERLDNIISALSSLRDSASPTHEYHADLQACVRSSLETVGQLRYRKRDCHEMMRLSRISEQFVGDVGLDIVRPHRRLVRSSKLVTLKATDYYIDPKGAGGTRADIGMSSGDEQIVIGGGSLLFFLFNDCLLAASVSTRLHDDGTLTPEKRAGGVSFTATPGSTSSAARQAALMAFAKKSASKTRTGFDSPGNRPAMLYRMEAAVPLLGAKVTDEQDVPENGVDHAIRVDDVTGQALVMCAQSEKDKQEWLQDLRSMAVGLEETLASPYAFSH